jgi:hypothetical protein
MVQPDVSTDFAFAPAVLRGLVALGPIDLREADMTLELGLSLWLHRSSTSVDEAVDALAVVKDALVEAAGMDPEFEPIPLVGRAPRDDLMNLAGYVSQLIPRAVRAANCTAEVLIDGTIDAVGHLEMRHVMPSRAAG